MPGGRPSKYDYGAADLAIIEGLKTDGQIAQETGIPNNNIRQRRLALNKVIDARRVAIASQTKIPPQERKRMFSATESYLDLMRKNQQSTAPITQALMRQVMMHAVSEETLLSPTDLNQLANTLSTLQKAMKAGLTDIQQSILSLLDYELVGTNQAAELFEVLNASQDDFRKRTQAVLGGYEKTKQEKAEHFLQDLEVRAEVDAVVEEIELEEGGGDTDA